MLACVIGMPWGTKLHSPCHRPIATRTQASSRPLQAPHSRRGHTKDDLRKLEKPDRQTRISRILVHHGPDAAQPHCMTWRAQVIALTGPLAAAACKLCFWCKRTVCTQRRRREPQTTHIPILLAIHMNASCECMRPMWLTLVHHVHAHPAAASQQAAAQLQLQHAEQGGLTPLLSCLALDMQGPRHAPHQPLVLMHGLYPVDVMEGNDHCVKRYVLTAHAWP